MSNNTKEGEPQCKSNNGFGSETWVAVIELGYSYTERSNVVVPSIPIHRAQKQTSCPRWNDKVLSFHSLSR
jgi:hypothetical protein